MRAVKINVPNPSSEQVEHYLRAWDELENYHLQEDALDKLFFTLCPENIDMLDILLKVVALNDFIARISSLFILLQSISCHWT